MEDSHKFMKGQIVWAKASYYPWWPAQIARINRNGNHKVYRVNFFGDPSYSYLQQQSLLDFQCGLTKSEISSEEFKLEKPMQLAQEALKKINHPPEQPKEQSKLATDYSHLTNTLSLCEYELKKMEENAIQYQQQSQYRYQELTNVHPQHTFEDININNVIEILSGSSFRCLETMKGYNNRKNLGQIHEKLKCKLLQKYNLYQLPKPEKQQRKIVEITPIRKILICKLKKTKKKKVKQQCIKKLYKILRKREKPMNRGMVIEKIDQLGVYEQDKKYFRQSYRPLIYMLSKQKQELTGDGS